MASADSPVQTYAKPVPEETVVIPRAEFETANSGFPDVDAEPAPVWPVSGVDTLTQALTPLTGLTFVRHPWGAVGMHRRSPSIEGVPCTVVVLPVLLAGHFEGAALSAALNRAAPVVSTRIPEPLRGRIPVDRVVWAVSAPGGRALTYCALWDGDQSWVPVYEPDVSRWLGAELQAVVQSERESAGRGKRGLLGFRRGKK